MNARRAATLCCTLCFTALLTFGAYWTEKAQNPSWFPYKTGTGNTLWMDLPIPTPSQSDPAMPAIVSPFDPLKDVQGYWPLYYSVGCFANGRFYVGCGLGPQVSWGTAGYAWPSNSYGNGYSYNRQSGFAIYNPQDNTWDCAKWDESGPVGFNYVTWGSGNVQGGGSKMPECSDGTLIGSTQSFAYDWDHDGTEEIFLHAGYPHWDGNNFIYDPDSDTWTNSAAALNFSSGSKAQYYGGCVRVDSNIYAIGGYSWGPDTKCNMQIYNPYSDSWLAYENLYPAALREFGIGAIGTKIYLLGGNPTPASVYMFDTENIAAGITNIGTLAIGVTRPSVVQWRGLLYVVGGLTAGGLTNLFQVFNPLTASTTINNVPLPVNANAASCAVDTNGTFYFGGAMRFLESNGTAYNSSRLWVAPLPQQDILASPTSLNFWQTNATLQLRLDNMAFVPITCSNTPSVAWLTISSVVTVPNQSNVVLDVTIDRGMYTGPTNGTILIRYGSSTITVQVLADTLRPVATLTPASTITLQPRTKSFVLGNIGAVAMAFTNTSAQAFVTDITPGIGVLAPNASTTVSFTVTAAAPRPSVGTIQIGFNSYNGTPDVFTISNYPADYYVSISGDNANNGTSLITAWRNIAFGVTNIPNGSTEEGSITLNVGAGTYAGESTDPSGTNWIIDLSNRQFINLIGAGAEQSILTRGTKNWLISFGRDTYAEYPVIKLFDSQHVRVSGFTVMGNDPPAYTDGTGEGASAPDMLAALGINGGNGVRVDHMYLNGLYTGMVYNAALSNWVYSWASWWYFGMCVDGAIGPSNATIDHVLVRGFRNAIQNNSYPFRDVANNINKVLIDHCTFVEGLCVSEDVAAVTVKCGTSGDMWLSPSFRVNNSIIGNYPWAQFPAAGSAFGLQASYAETRNSELALISTSNQFWSCGVPVPGEAWWNDQVFYNTDPDPFDNYTNEVPTFETVGGLPYSTQLETPYGTRDVGWNVVPEPATLGVVALALALRRRR